MSRRFFDPEICDFISISDGREFIHKSEIVALKWEKHYSKEDYLNSEKPMESTIRLKVFFADCPTSTFSGEDAKSIMRSLGLPENPPESLL